MSQAQIPYSSGIDRAFDFTNTRDESIPAPYLSGRIKNTICATNGSNGSADGFMDVSVPVVGVNYGAWATTPFDHDNMDVHGGCVNMRDVPKHNMVNITISSLRLRGFRLPPQTYEGDRHKLYHRLIREGADPSAVAVVRGVIFADGVTVDALMAPIRTREMSLAHGGAKRMWHMLLETKEMMPGKKKYLCLLCPVGSRPGYNHDRDAIRHFNRDHFGFSFPCKHWYVDILRSPLKLG